MIWGSGGCPQSQRAHRSHYGGVEHGTECTAICGSWASAESRRRPFVPSLEVVRGRLEGLSAGCCQSRRLLTGANFPIYGTVPPKGGSGG